MTKPDIASLRVYNQHLNHDKFKKPEDVVGYMCAMQAQEYTHAKWAIGLRMLSPADKMVEKAITTGTILRTHVLRPTWHFVLPQDIRWMLSLTAPRINAGNAAMYKKQEVTDAIFNKSFDVFTKALQGGKQLTRTEIAAALNQANIATDDFRLTILLMKAELEQLICSGARQGKQFTYALLDERAPVTPAISRDEAVTRLVLRYFKSHGPATVNDFVHWSGLTVADAKTGIEINKTLLSNITIGGVMYWMGADRDFGAAKKSGAYLLPVYDELIIAYKNRDAMIPAGFRDKMGAITFFPTIMVNNQVVGNWSRNMGKKNIDIELKPFNKLNKAQNQSIESAIQRFKKFNGIG
ncbi:winged helix DNA-binding domain-containing protein [Mucilaginibacter sp. P25]|uniref:Winged helix DNA-binding domain-containing protein n=1 Tax=Mucilaginibacter gossypii TaxID=551996 RepID=A0A1G7YWR2_9SPHI|nr:winged helix DNA-binding domain-containing protein [Mucilaginibacter gossypii]SDH00953.1 Winged helix DNA-binding domain-containing protein [Mucilaginibacter gossypii]